MKDKITLLVNSCDKNVFLWEIFAKMFNLHWDTRVNIDKYILSETEYISLDGFDIILAGKGSWSDNVLYALDQIKTKYVLWWLEDFLMVNKMPWESFESFLYLMETYNSEKLVVHYPHSELKLDPFIPEYNIYKMNQTSPYTTTLQPSLWEVDHFKSCLVKNETPWQFEIEGTLRLNKRKHNIFLYQIFDRWHFEALSRGKFTQDYYRIITAHNLQHLHKQP